MPPLPPLPQPPSEPFPPGSYTATSPTQPWPDPSPKPPPPAPTRLTYEQRAERYVRQNCGRPLSGRQWRRIDKKIDRAFYRSLSGGVA